MKFLEADLDHAFAEQLETDRTFLEWLIAGGRFSRFASTARLLCSEQAEERTAKHWWKHWWCAMPNGDQWETDIFAVLDTGGFRFAMHIENKPLHGKLTLEQASAYRPRAAYKAFDAAWLGYTDFETILLAPASLLTGSAEQACQFDRCISYEDLGGFVPLFADAASS